MAFSSRPYANRYIPSSSFPAGTKWLLIVNSGLTILYLILQTLHVATPLDHFLLIPGEVIYRFFVWQIVTYMFLHAGPMHLLWNMLALWMFGAELERTWGTARFLRFYFYCGVVAGVIVVLASLILGGMGYATLGASGAILGLLVGYAVVFPDRMILFGFLIPMKSKYFVMIIGAVVLFQSFTSVASGAPTGVAVMAHVGGLLTGYLLLRGKRLYLLSVESANSGYKDWKIRRAKRKFAVYLRKQDSRRDRTLH